MEVELILSPVDASNDGTIRRCLVDLLKRDIGTFIKKKQSIDARKWPVKVRLLLEVFEVHEPVENTLWTPQFPKLSEGKTALIVGFGPAGMFAAIRLLELGVKPIIVERGKKVQERRRDLAVLNREGLVNPDSNYCFGEGGAGTYSDGKLYTRSKKRGDVRKILEIFVAHGADPRILYEAHPHIGTNKLPQIVESIRETILSAGGEIHFNEKLTNIDVEGHKVKKISLASGRELSGEKLILATGHSARDIFELLDKKQVLIEAKPFALGVRVEHPQHVIDSIQYHCDNRGEYLPPASYSLVEQAQGRGVFSFCMCPGGIIAPAATSGGEIVVNGWSPSKRNGQFANSGMVVSIDERDWQKFAKSKALAAMKFQEEVEQTAYQSIANKLMAPAQKLTDFLDNRTSSELPECSYIPGVSSYNLNKVLPRQVAESLKLGLRNMGRKMRGYLSSEAILVGVESRTSSPVKIPRNKETLQHPQIEGLFPCGEGAGYAGGIVSAALDGMACAEKACV